MANDGTNKANYQFVEGYCIDIAYGQQLPSVLATLWACRFDPPEGMAFVAWSTKADGTGWFLQPGEYIDAVECPTLYAIWGPAPIPTATAKPTQGVTETPTPTNVVNPTPTPTGVVPPEHIQLGDVDFNGDIDVFDLVLIRDYIFGVQNFDALEFFVADVDASDEIDVFDLVAVRDHIFGLEELEAVEVPEALVPLWQARQKDVG